MVKKERVDFKLDSIDGVGPTKMKRMEESGLRYLHDICMSSAEEIKRITGLDMDKATRLWNDSRDALEKANVIRPRVMSALEIYKYKRDLPTLSSGSEAIDILFGGKGPKQESLTEVYGAFGSGKTQYLMSCIVEVLNNGDKAFVIDCEDTFDVERLLEIARARGYLSDEEDDMINFLDRLIIRTATNSTETFNIINNITEEMIKGEVKLVVIDGAIGQIRKEFLGRGELSDRQNYLKPLMSKLGAMPLYFKCWVMMTNQVQHDPGQFFGDPTKPIGGNIVGHEPTHRMYVMNDSDTKWRAKMVDSPHFAKLTMPFKLSNRGVEDIPEELRKAKKILCNIIAKTLVSNNLDMSEIKLVEKINSDSKIISYNINYNILEKEVKAFKKEVSPKDYKANEGPTVELDLPSEEGLIDKSLLSDDEEITIG